MIAIAALLVLILSLTVLARLIKKGGGLLR